MRRVVAMLVVCVLGHARIAGADDAADAAALYDQGKVHYDLAEYTQAIAKWKGSYRLSKEPLLLFNIAQAYRLSGNCAEANRFYLTYQKLVPKPPNAAELAAAMEKCAGIEPATGESVVEPGPAVQPQPQPAPVAPPAPVVTPPVHVDAYADRGKPLRIAGIATVGAGILAGGLAVVFAASARDKSNAIADQPIGTRFDPDLVQTESDGRGAQTRARIFGIAGLAAVGAGGALWWFGHQRANVRIEASLAPRHSQVVLTCAF